MVSMMLPPTIVDLTDKTSKAMRIRVRPSVQIDSIVLHQTAFSRGTVPVSYLDVHAHFVLLPDGRAVQLHPIESYLVSSSAFNNASIAIEVVGNFADDKGNWWQGAKFGKHTLTPDQISGGRDLIRYLVDEWAIGFIFAHRQGEAPNLRGNCPGPDIWYNLGQWAVDNLGLSDGGAGYTEGKGGAIPDSWRQPRETTPKKS